MNKMKISLFVIFLIFESLFARKSVALATDYKDKNISIELTNNSDKFKLTIVNSENVIINSLSIENDYFSLKKGKVVDTKNLKSGFSSNVYVSVYLKNFQFYTLIPSLCDNVYGVSGLKFESNYILFDFSIFESMETERLIYSRSYYINDVSLNDMSKGLLSILEFENEYLNIRTESASTIKGFYFSTSISLLYNNLKLSFEHQNLNYKYNVGLNIKFRELNFSINDRIYKASPFSGEGIKRDYLVSGTLTKSIDYDLIFDYKIKSLKFKYDECIKFDENLNRTSNSDFYAILSLISNSSDLVNFKVGYVSKTFLWELKINGIKFGYKDKEYYSFFEFKNMLNNLSMTYKYQFNKKFEIILKYYW
ncbi:MAG: hypothetical protein JJE21_07265 [Spirochaetaceae bacterium]|nr:hypothetical protein [Spirochaetaceae bacterium]